MPKVTYSAHGEEGDQLHDRLEGDRRHHALVALATSSARVPNAMVKSAMKSAT
jgi:hypothetical protein